MRRLDDFKGFVADLARPFAIWSSSAAAAFATVRIAWIGHSYVEAAAFMTAVWAGVGGLYFGRAWENRETVKAGANVEIAKANSALAPPEGAATLTVTPPAAVEITTPGADEGVLPANQRVHP